MSKPGECIKCGQPVGEHESFCFRCKEDVNQRATNPARKISKWWAIIPGVLCVGCLAYLVLSKAAGQSIPALRWLAWGGMGGFGAIAYSLWRGK